MTARSGWIRAGVVVVALSATALAAAAEPQIKPVGRAAMLEKLVDCRKVADNTARLACYDAAAAALDQAEAKGDIVVVDRAQARKVRREAFGFHLPSISLFQRGESEKEIDNITGTVAAANQNALGGWTIRLGDGAVWTQIDNTELPLDPKVGQPVKIRRASFGSYLMSIGNQRAIRVHRVE